MSILYAWDHIFQSSAFCSTLMMSSRFERKSCTRSRGIRNTMTLTHFPCKKVCIYGVLLAVSLTSIQCSTMSQVSDLRDIPRFHSIKVVTKSGQEHVFQSWHLTSDSALVGFVRTEQSFRDNEVRSRWEVLRIPRDNIVAIYTFDLRLSSTAETAFIVGGIVICVVFLWQVLRSVSLFSGYRWN